VHRIAVEARRPVSVLGPPGGDDMLANLRPIRIAAAVMVMSGLLMIRLR